VKVRQDGDDDGEMIRIEASADRPRKRRKKMRKSKRNVRKGRSRVARRETSRRIRVEDTEFSHFNDRGKEVPPGVTRVPRGKST
jgi:hypothetical protein